MSLSHDLVREDFAAVNRLIAEQLHSHVDLVEDIGQHIVAAGGKRLRPMIALLTARACGVQEDRHIPFAAAVEFIHTATLLHDDVVDMSTLRRGRPTANATWGNAPSVLVGDFIYSRAFQLLVKQRNFSILELMADTTNLIAEGEVLQLARAGNPDSSTEDYFAIIEAKTATLFAAAAQGGAMTAGASHPQQVAMRRYGHHLGLAFQLIDDALDYEGSPDVMGKNLGDDLADGKVTLPLLHVLKEGSASEAELIREAIRQRSAEDFDAIRRAVMNTGALDHVRMLASQHSDRAGESLAVLPESTFRSALLDLTTQALQRKK